MNDKSITFKHSIRHLHLIRAAVGKLHGNYFWFRIKADRLKLDPLSVNESFAQILERERESKPGKGPPRLYLNLLGPVFHLVVLALLRRRRLRSEINFELARNLSLFDFAP